MLSPLGLPLRPVSRSHACFHSGNFYAVYMKYNPYWFSSFDYQCAFYCLIQFNW
jgi:hypothetical protein